jgi:hypothetical protein
MAEIVFAVLEKMFSVFKIVIFLVKTTICSSQKLFSEVETTFCASEKCFSITEKIVGKAQTQLGLTFWAFKRLKK